MKILVATFPAGAENANFAVYEAWLVRGKWIREKSFLYLLAGEAVPANVADFDLVCVEDGNQAVQIIQRMNFDLLIIDQRLAILEGSIVVKTARENDQNVPIIFLPVMVKDREQIAQLPGVRIMPLTADFLTIIRQAEQILTERRAANVQEGQ